MILVTLRLVVPNGRQDEIVDVFWLLRGPVRAEPGCRLCGLFQDLGHDGVLVYAEVWETQEQLERHLRSARYERVLALMEASAEPPVLRYQWVACTRGLEYLEAVRLGASPLPPPGPDDASSG